MSGDYREPPAVIDPDALASLAGKPCVHEVPPHITVANISADWRRFHMGGDPVETMPGIAARADPRECKACRARGSARGRARWEWAIIRPRYGELVAMRARVGGWETRRLATGLVVAARPCPACTVDGQPTGVER